MSIPDRDRRARGAKVYVDSGLALLARARHARPGATAILLVLKGDLDSARSAYSRLAPADIETNGARVELAVIAAHQGDTTTALRTFAVLDSFAKNEFDHGWARWDQARILSQLGRKQEAVRYLNMALAEGHGFSLTLHTDWAFDPLRDYPSFKERLRPRE